MGQQAVGSLPGMLSSSALHSPHPSNTQGHAASPPGCPKPPARVPSYTWWAQVTEAAFCTPLPCGIQHYLKHVSLQLCCSPRDSPSSPQGSWSADSRQPLGANTPPSAALSIPHLCFSSCHTKYHCSDRVWRRWHAKEVNHSSTVFTEEEESSS